MFSWQACHFNTVCALSSARMKSPDLMGSQIHLRAKCDNWSVGGKFMTISLIFSRGAVRRKSITDNKGSRTEKQ